MVPKEEPIVVSVEMLPSQNSIAKEKEKERDKAESEKLEEVSTSLKLIKEDQHKLRSSLQNEFIAIQELISSTSSQIEEELRKVGSEGVGQKQGINT